MIDTGNDLPTLLSPNTEMVYDSSTRNVIALTINELNWRSSTTGISCGQQFFLKKGLDKFGEQGQKGVMKELTQMHDQKCFIPIYVGNLNAQEKQHTMTALMFLTEKKDGEVNWSTMVNLPESGYLGKKRVALLLLSKASPFLW